MLISSLMLMCTTLIFLLSTPISCLLLLIILTLLISFKALHILHSPWLPLMIFLMLVGGMLILFIYMTTISPNKKSHHMTKLNLTIMSLLTLIIMTPSYQPDPTPSNTPMMIYSMITNPPFMIFSITYLFMFLLILTSILNKNKAPLRSS